MGTTCSKDTSQKNTKQPKQPKQPKQKGSRKRLSDSEIKKGQSVWIGESNDPSIPEEGIGGKIKYHELNSGSDAGTGYTTKILLNNGVTVTNCMFYRFYYVLYSW